MRETILIVDDEPSQRLTASHFVGKKLGYEAVEVGGGEEAIDYIREKITPVPDLVLLDLSMPGVGGIEVLEKIRPDFPNLPVIVLTASEDVSDAVDAMQAGATDFMTKPFKAERLQVSIENALKMNRLGQEVQRLTRSVEGQVQFSDLIGQSPAFMQMIQLAERASDSTIPVLITGESGVGKEIIARAIHGSSERAGHAFIAVNCGAIPENLVESTLFGHEKGAFTGAIQKALGKFREAEGGTLFLDEVGELKPDIQVKLLRALQESEVEPVGAGRSVKVDVRIISATNRNLEQMVADGTFREDLFYRLNVFQLPMPSLRERREDILLLANHFLQRFSLSENRHLRGMAPATETLLECYDWPGNVRQLENMLFRAVVMSAGEWLMPEDCTGLSSGSDAGKPVEQSALGATSISAAGESAPTVAQSAWQLPLVDEAENFRTMASLETEIIQKALRYFDGSMTAVSRALGIGRSTLYRKIQMDDS